MEVSRGHYSNKQQILLVGEGDFSFSFCLARSFGSATNITATSLDTRGFDFGRERESYAIMKHKQVVRAYFASAKEFVEADGEIHVTHKTAYPFSNWNIKTLGEEKGLYCYRTMEFETYQYPGYSNKRGNGSHCDSSFPVGECSTFMFKKR